METKGWTIYINLAILIMYGIIMYVVCVRVIIFLLTQAIFTTANNAS